MTIALACLLCFAGWTLALVLVGIGPYRVSRVLLGQARPRDFPSDQPHGPDAYRRLMRAHANCVENLPLFATVVLLAWAIRDSAGWTREEERTFDTLAIVYLIARVAQSLVHIASGRSIAVNVRFTFFLIQLGVLIAMGLKVAGALAG